MMGPPKSWKELVEQRFDASSWAPRWEEAAQTLHAGSVVEGRVALRAPFGVWVDVPPGVPALLMWPDAKGVPPRAYEQADVLPLGCRIRARVLGVRADERAIRLGQVEQRWHQISDEERNRLRLLVEACRTLDDVVATLGKPDDDRACGVFDGQWHRALTYDRLSEQGLVLVVDSSPGIPGIDIIPKCKSLVDLVPEDQGR